MNPIDTVTRLCVCECKAHHGSVNFFSLTMNMSGSGPDILKRQIMQKLSQYGQNMNWKIICNKTRSLVRNNYFTFSSDRK